MLIFAVKSKGKEKFMNQATKKDVVPVFFAVDENYLPFLYVTLLSIKDNVSENRNYKFVVMNNGISEDGIKKFEPLKATNFEIYFLNVSEKAKSLRGNIVLRDFYTETTYYRLFIHELFPDLDKALYVDCDTIISDDIAKLYDFDLGDNYLGAAYEAVSREVSEIEKYTIDCLGLGVGEYFNAGVILMNLKLFRERNFTEKYNSISSQYKFAVAQDQDYLNVMCKGKVKFFDKCWNTEPIEYEKIKDKFSPKLVHYTLTAKPWHYDDVPYADLFWNVAKRTPYYDYLYSILKNYPQEKVLNDSNCEKALIALSLKEAIREDNFYKTFGDKFAL